PEQSEMARGEATRIFAQAALTDLPDSDRAYLVQLVSRQTGMNEEQAGARVDDVLTSVEAAKQQAADAADEARNMGILDAFLVPRQRRRRVLGSADRRPSSRRGHVVSQRVPQVLRRKAMLRGLGLWLLGVPIWLIIVILIFI